jgi:hypothetical protein
MALAHRVGDKSEGEYWRNDLLPKRRLMMSGRAKFCAKV